MIDAEPTQTSEVTPPIVLETGNDKKDSTLLPTIEDLRRLGDKLVENDNRIIGPAEKKTDTPKKDDKKND